MYTVTVRDRIMVAHSFRGEVFGPARALHGATYVVEVSFARPELDADNIVVDIGRARAALRAALAVYDYRNLDEAEEFRGIETTTEFLARDIHRRVSAAIAAGALGPGAAGVTGVKVALRESDVAWASYEGPPA